MSVQPGGLYIHLPLHTQVLGLLRRQEHVVSSQTGEFLYSLFTCEKRMHANPLVAQSRSRSHSSLSSDCFIRLTEKVYSQIRSISITVRDF